MAIIDLSLKDCKFTWLDIVDPDEKEVKFISEKYHLHEYTLRDCLEPDHLPKREQMGDTNFILSRLLTGETKQKADSIQEMTNKIAMFYHPDFLITIHRRPQELLNNLRESITRVNSSNELVIKILHKVLSTYDLPGDRLSAQVDALETKVFLKRVNQAILEDLYYIKRKATVSHKLLLLSGDAISSIKTTDSSALQDLKDLHIKLLHLYGQIYEDVNNLLNIYLSISSQKTNEVVKVLTLFSAFFLPLTFIAGIYGMNFREMPELEHSWGYPLALLFMAGTGLIIFFWFKKKHWL